MVILAEIRRTICSVAASVIMASMGSDGSWVVE